jgi:transforming growth factor-beta-induced protein
MRTYSSSRKSLLHFLAGLLFLALTVFTACRKSEIKDQPPGQDPTEQAALAEARLLEQNAAASAEKEGAALQLSTNDKNKQKQKNIVEIAVSNSNFSSLVAAVLKTGLAGALSNPSANLTVFAPTNAAFRQLPAPFNTAKNIEAISDAGQIDFLRNVLLYHVLGAEVFSRQVERGRSSAATLKPRGSANDNTIYLSKTFGLIRVNGQSDVIWPDINASNGVIHAINKVLLFPTNNIAQIAIDNGNFTALVAALVKTNLSSVFLGEGDFSVFAPTDAAFAQLPAPFNSAANISNIQDQAQIDALANILKYHVIGERYFTWDLGILARPVTLANAPGNKLTTILGYNTGYLKGDANSSFTRINPGDILATNGVIHVIGQVLLPRN